MKLHEFKNKYFADWRIAGWTCCGTDCGNMTLVSGETCIRVFFQLNGDTHWTGNRVTVEHVEGCDMI